MKFKLFRPIESISDIEEDSATRTIHIILQKLTRSLYYHVIVLDGRMNEKRIIRQKIKNIFLPEHFVRHARTKAKRKTYCRVS